MSFISFNDVYCSLKKASTWGTEVVVSSGINLFASSIAISGGYADFLSRDFGQGGKRSNNARLAATFDVSITCDLTFGQGWLTLLSGFLGTESTPAETTGGQADYSCNMDLADNNNGLFWTLAYMIETDRVMAIPTLKVVGFTLAMDINGAGTVTFQCIADRVLESSTSSAANVSGNTKYPYETAIMGSSANQYFRIANYSTGTPLSNTHDKQISGITIAASRPLGRRYGFRAANSPFTTEPLANAPIDATLTVRHTELDNAGYDVLTDFFSPGFKMAEFFVDGSQIGTGVNRSYKIQLPYMKFKGQFPAGHDVPSNAGFFAPVATYDLLKASAAPSGMTGVTDLIRVVPIFPTRTTKWQA